MATKKPKSGKSNKGKSTTKPKTAAKTVEEPVSEAPIINAEEEVTVEEQVEVEDDVEDVTEPETSEVAETTETVELVEKVEKIERIERIEKIEKPEPTPIVSEQKSSCFKGFFARKYDEKEGILTVFKTPKFYGALLGEIIGTALLTILLFAVSLMGIASLATYSFALIAILIGVYAFSSACLNPLVTVGMMASRRMSVIRGVMYIIAEILGAWLGWLVFNSFHLAGGEAAYDVPAMAAIAEDGFWPVAMIELFGAVIIAFFFARALKYKRSIFTFAATATGGVIFAIVVGYVVSAAFFGFSSNFIFNPAVALMYQIFPTAGESFGEIIGGVGQALAIYALFPMLGGVCGFYLSDFAGKLSAED